MSVDGGELPSNEYVLACDIHRLLQTRVFSIVPSISYSLIYIFQSLFMLGAFLHVPFALIKAFCFVFWKPTRQTNNSHSHCKQLNLICFRLILHRTSPAP
jgi:hypothetical protein